MRASRRLRAGQVFVNEWYAGGVETPFGGFGKSGYGREKGREALFNYVQTKNIAIKDEGMMDQELFEKGLEAAQGNPRRRVCGEEPCCRG
jgi:delta 1-pyrroline-5-carboxylate dehydrogenase